MGIATQIPHSGSPQSGAVEAIYREADAAVARFAEKSGLKCPMGCGRCCESPLIEATPLECLPLALSLLPKSKEWLAILDVHIRTDRKLPSSCPFYVSLGFGKGMCSVYEQRPLICRLFGFAAFVDDTGAEQLDHCHYHLEAGTQMPSADPDNLGNSKAPLYRNFKRRLKRLAADNDPAWTAPLPLAQAVRIALQLVDKTAQALTRFDNSKNQVLPASCR